MDCSKVVAYKQKNNYYSDRAPFFPSAIFEEYPFKDSRIDRKNEIYDSLRQVFRMLGLDSDNFGTKKWNPLRELIQPGMTVLIKPNLMHQSGDSGDTRGLITHGSLIRAAADYAYIALKGNGRIIIADGPMEDADFEKILKVTGLIAIKEFYKKAADFDMDIYDLRSEKLIKKYGKGAGRVSLAGDPMGYTAIDLAEMSEFENGNRGYETTAGPDGEMGTSIRHSRSRHEYIIANTILKADAVISLPKMKTHKRSGVTLSLKNMIGITGDRKTLPHFSRQCFSNRAVKHRIHNLIYNCTHRMLRKYKNALKNITGATEKDVKSGNFYGNDIIWRTILDLFKIVNYGNVDGKAHREKQRKFLIILDGIVGGEGQGPTDPDSKPCGVLIAGFNPFCVDMTASRLMGFDPMKIPKFKNIPEEKLKKFSETGIDEIQCISNREDWNKKLSDFKGKCLNFKPHHAWRHHIEADI
ncbi:MAG: DUF362 domain-containing protein [Candidatus Omnitrophota bacterium]|nr:DUF362 domain-containing protein [Candidatus Omnitrophota bacterium]